MAKKRRMMEVLLMEDVTQVGKAGDLVKVSPGFARNFLLPMNRAAKPSAESLRLLEERKKRDIADREKREEALRGLADAIPATNVTLEMKVSADGKLYGAVTSQMIADAMQNAGLDVQPQQVRLEQTIKEIGQFDVPIHVYGDTTVNARLWVVNAP